MDIFDIIFRSGGFGLPGDLSEEDRAKMHQQFLDTPAVDLMQELFRQVLERTNMVSGSVIEFFEGALASLEGGGFEKAIRVCDCAHCRFKRDFIREAVPALVDSIRTLRALHLKWHSACEAANAEQESKGKKKRDAQDIIARGQPEKFS